MKDVIRITLIIFVFVGSTALFGFWSIRQFDMIFYDLNTSIASAYLSSQPSGSSGRTSGSTTPSSVSTSSLKFNFISPTKESEFFIGCTYKILWESPTVVTSIETALIDTGTQKASGPITSGLSKNNKVDGGLQSLDWKVGNVWPGEYYIKVSSINDTEIEEKSKNFTISKIPNELDTKGRESFCSLHNAL